MFFFGKGYLTFDGEWEWEEVFVVVGQVCGWKNEEGLFLILGFEKSTASLLQNLIDLIRRAFAFG